MTKEQKEYYLQHKGLRCPYCKSDQLSADGFELADAEGLASEEVQCDECHSRWRDTFVLSDVEDI